MRCGHLRKEMVPMTVQEFKEAVDMLREDGRIREETFNWKNPCPAEDLEDFFSSCFPPVVPDDTVEMYLSRCRRRWGLN